MTVGVGLLLASAIMGCGRSASGPVVTVGQIEMRPAMVERWETALRRGLVNVKRDPHADRRVQALSFLISGFWLIDEAAEQKVSVPSGAVALRVDELLGPLSEAGRVRHELARMGLTLADMEFKVRAELSAAALRGLISHQVRELTHPELVDYYQRHLSAFWHEYRVVDLVEHQHTRSAALTMAKELGTGRGFRKRAIHEIVTRLIGAEVAHATNRNLVRAIFAAPVQHVSQPISYAGLWVIFVVRQIVRAPVPLPAVEGRVAKFVQEARVQSATRAFFYRHRGGWQARTTCKRGFIAPGCSESHEDLDFAASPLAVD